MGKPTIVVNNVVSRIHLYTGAAITAYVYDRATGKDLTPRHGTVFAVKGAVGLYFVTNRHVLESEKTQSGLDRIEISGYLQTEDESSAPTPWQYKHKTPAVVFHPDPNTDLALIPLPMYTPRFGSVAEQPELLAATSPWSVMSHGLEWLASEAELRQLLPGDQVHIAGYPGVAYTDGGGRSVNKDDRPIIVSGIVASDARYPATFGDTRPHNAVLCHSFSWGGMSGAPVFGFSESIGTTKILGVNAGHIKGQGTSGGVISYFVRSSALLELLAEVGEVPGQNFVAGLEWHEETEGELNEGK